MRAAIQGELYEGRDAGARLILVLLGKPRPTPEEEAAACYAASAVFSLRVLARGQTITE